MTSASFPSERTARRQAVYADINGGAPQPAEPYPGRAEVPAAASSAALRGRRARIEYLVNGFVDFLIRHRHYAVMASTDPAAKRDKLDTEATTMRRRALTLLFGDNPTGAERLSFNAMFFIPECLPDLADLTDDELREALQTTLLHMLRVPSGSRE